MSLSQSEFLLNPVHPQNLETFYFPVLLMVQFLKPCFLPTEMCNYMRRCARPNLGLTLAKLLDSLVIWILRFLFWFVGGASGCFWWWGGWGEGVPGALQNSITCLCCYLVFTHYVIVLEGWLQSILSNFTWSFVLNTLDLSIILKSPIVSDTWCKTFHN